MNILTTLFICVCILVVKDISIFLFRHTKQPQEYLRGRYHNIPIYVLVLSNNGADVMGRNNFYGMLSTILLWWDTTVIEVDEYPIWIEEDENN